MAEPDSIHADRHEVDCRTRCRICGGCSVIETTWISDLVGKAVIECVFGHVWEEMWLVDSSEGNEGDG